MDVSLRPDAAFVRPWRTAALVAAAVAAVELVALVAVVGALLLPDTPARRAPAARSAAHPRTVSPAPTRQAAPATAELPRRKVSVLVLNGNGLAGAAARAAARVSRRGYRIRGVADAPRRDFTRSVVMYRRGFEREGRRLARDLGIRIVGPLDGIRPGELRGAQAVLVVGTPAR